MSPWQNRSSKESRVSSIIAFHRRRCQRSRWLTASSLCYRFAFIDFATEEAVAAAVAKSEGDLNGRALLIKDSKNYEKTGRPKRDPVEGEAVADGGKAGDRIAKKQKNPPSPTVFVGNLSFNTTREAIQQQFEPCGRIRKVRLATFQDTGKCKG
jgi:RNA recognition motif-containing protein